MRNTRGFAHVGLLVLVVLVIAAITGIGLAVSSKNSKGGESLVDKVASTFSGSSNDPTGWDKGCEGEQRVQMTNLPMNVSDVATFTPYGLTAGAHVTPIDHVYFYPQPGPRDTYPVYAMADGYLIEIGVRSVMTDNAQPKDPEYRYVIQHSCQTVTYFDLITKIDDSILNEFPKAASEGMSGRFPVKAGQVVGWIGGQSLDTGVYNLDLTLPGFISPEMYKSEPWKIHTDDFYSYFSEAHQAQIHALNERKAEPYSGKIDYDQPGKLIGNWFLEGTNGYAGASGNTGVGDGSGRGYWTGHLAIFYHHIQTDAIIVSLGEFKDGSPQAFGVSGNAPDPASITKASGVVKYELVQAPRGNEALIHPQVMGTVLFEVLDGEKLKVEVFPDKTAPQVSGFVSPKVYER